MLTLDAPKASAREPFAAFSDAYTSLHGAITGGAIATLGTMDIVLGSALIVVGGSVAWGPILIIGGVLAAPYGAGLILTSIVGTASDVRTIEGASGYFNAPSLYLNVYGALLGGPDALKYTTLASSLIADTYGMRINWAAGSMLGLGLGAWVFGNDLQDATSAYRDYLGLPSILVNPEWLTQVQSLLGDAADNSANTSGGQLAVPTGTGDVNDPGFDWSDLVDVDEGGVWGGDGGAAPLPAGPIKY